MAYEVANGNIVELSLRYEVESQVCIFTRQYVLSGVGSGVEGEELFDAVADVLDDPDQLLDQIRSCIAQEATIRELVLQVIWPVRYKRSVYPLTLGGLINQPALPPNVAVCLTLQPDLAGRHVTGQVHMGAVPTTFVENGRIAGPAGGAYEALGNWMVLTIEPGNGVVLTPIIYRRTAPGLSLVPTSVKTESTTRTMRRRTVGVGI